MNKELREKALYQTERWWQQMHLDSLPEGMLKAPSRYRAELRRCATADAAMLTEGFRALWLALPEEVQNDRRYSIEAWATIAAMLSHVVEKKSASFGACLGELDARTGKPIVSELRLQQLQGARNSQEFFSRLHRLIKQLKGKADPIQLTQDILDWFDEHYALQPRRADKRVAVRWALNYYQQANR